jgi:hypothetical protein
MDAKNYIILNVIIYKVVLFSSMYWFCYLHEDRVFWDVTLFHQVSGSWCLEGVWCLHFQGWWVQKEFFFISQKTGILNKIAVETLNFVSHIKKDTALRDGGICHITLRDRDITFKIIFVSQLLQLHQDLASLSIRTWDRTLNFHFHP